VRLNVAGSTSLKLKAYQLRICRRWMPCE
jgi:hypothetical protein